MKQINTSRNAPKKSKGQWLKEAITSYNEEDYYGSLIACEEAIKIDPTYARAYHGKGLIFTHLQRYSEALSCYEQACKFAPEDAKTRLDLEELQRLLQAREEAREKAREEYEKAYQLEKQSQIAHSAKMKPLTDPLVERAQNALTVKNYAEAITLYKEAVKLDPYDSVNASALASLEKVHPYAFHGHPKYGYYCTCILCNKYDY